VEQDVRSPARESPWRWLERLPVLQLSAQGIAQADGCVIFDIVKRKYIRLQLL